MAYYNYKELRDALPAKMVDKWEAEDGSADYDSTLWSYGADYIKQLTKERNEARKLAQEQRDKLMGMAAMPVAPDLFPWEQNERIEP